MAHRDEVYTDAGPLAVSLSPGGALLPKDAGTSREALSKAKQQGRDHFVLHRASANRDAARRKTLATGDAIMRAMKDGPLTFAAQPIVDGVTGETELYEFLLRMLDENGDLAVNISGMSVTGPATLDHLLSLVQMHSGVADWLIFEITETVAMMGFEETARFANKRPELGCSIALDDFGAGHAPYQHLKNLAVDIEKIDSQFVKGLHENKGNQLFVQTLLDLAAGFGTEVAGECVETEAEAQALRDRGVRCLQGHHFGEQTWNALSLRRVPTA